MVRRALCPAATLPCRDHTSAKRAVTLAKWLGATAPNVIPQSDAPRQCQMTFEVSGMKQCASVRIAHGPDQRPLTGLMGRQRL